MTEISPLMLTEEIVGDPAWSPLSRWGNPGGFGATPKSQGNESQGFVLEQHDSQVW